MGLTEQLNDLKQQLGREIPRETLREIGRFVQGLVQSGIEKQAAAQARECRLLPCRMWQAGWCYPEIFWSRGLWF